MFTLLEARTRDVLGASGFFLAGRLWCIEGSRRRGPGLILAMASVILGWENGAGYFERAVRTLKKGDETAAERLSVLFHVFVSGVGRPILSLYGRCSPIYQCGIIRRVGVD